MDDSNDREHHRRFHSSSIQFHIHRFGVKKFTTPILTSADPRLTLEESVDGTPIEHFAFKRGIDDMNEDYSLYDMDIEKSDVADDLDNNDFIMPFRSFPSVSFDLGMFLW